jgi:hypothetical protein
MKGKVAQDKREIFDAFGFIARGLQARAVLAVIMVRLFLSNK